MALAQDFYMLQNVTITLNSGAVLAKTNVTVKRNPVFADRTGGATVQSQVWVKENAPDIMVEFFNTGDLSFEDLIPNTALTDFAIESTEAGAPTLLQSDFFTKFPIVSMVIGQIETGFDGENPSKCRVPIIANVLNPA